MAGYYDKNKDYSLAIKQAQDRGASQSEINQLRQERQNKIDSQYAGRDPYRGSSNIMGGGSRPNGSGVTYVPSRPAQQSKPIESIWKPSPNVGGAKDPIRNTTMRGGAGYENKRIGFGEWTHIFDENGKQVGRVKDHGASANGSVMLDQDVVNRSDAHRNAFEAAQRGDIDAVGRYLNEITRQNGPDERGEYDTTEANAYNDLLQLAYGDNFRNFYRKQYDQAYGAGAWDDPNHSAANPYVDPKYTAMAQQAQQSGEFLPSAPAGSPVIGGVSGGSGSFTPGRGPGGTAEDYLRQLAQAKKDAQEAALRAALQQGQANLNAHSEHLDDFYETQRNQTAAQRELEQMRLAEMGLAQGLNTGAVGQLAAGNSAAYMDALAGLGEKEAADRAAIDLQLQQMNNKFETDLAMGNAETDAWLYDQLYEEYLRQQAVEEARRKEAEQKEQFRMQMEAEQQAAAQKEAEAKAKILAGYGDFSGYAALGYTPQEIAAMQAGWNRLHPVKTGSGVRRGSSSGSSSTSNVSFDGTSGGEVTIGGGSGQYKPPATFRPWANPNISKELKLKLIENAVKSGQMSEEVGLEYLKTV